MAAEELHHTPEAAILLLSKPPPSLGELHHLLQELYPPSQFRPGHDQIDFATAPFGADQPLGHGRFGAVASGHLRGIGLDLSRTARSTALWQRQHCRASSAGRARISFVKGGKTLFNFGYCNFHVTKEEAARDELTERLMLSFPQIVKRRYAAVKGREVDDRSKSIRMNEV